MSLGAGVEVNDDIVKDFDEMKLRSKYAYIELQISDDMKKVELAKKLEKCSYDEFLNNLPEKDCRYCVFDLHLDLGDSGERNKLLFISWIPDDAPVKKKMIYASTSVSVKKKLLGISNHIEANDLGSLKYEEIEQKIKSSIK